MRDALLAWYRANKRDLPWRKTRDPYAIWLSEVMLQQTRVDTVIPYYARFLDAYPTVDALAEAPLDDVLAKWSGLGYYRRARALHAGALAIARDKKGLFPRTAADLEDVPGIGPYTAGAVASIAFGEPAPLVDGNVARVLSRGFEIDDDVTSTQGRARIWKIAADLVPERHPGDHNQALMELGATICTPKSPRCLVCPVRSHCLASAHGKQDELPRKAPRAAPKEWRRAAIVVSNEDGEVLLARRRGDRLFGGMWEPPAVDDDADEGTRATAALAKMLGLAKRAKYTEKEAVLHVLSHRKMSVRVLVAIAREATLGPSDEYDRIEWVDASALEKIGVSSLAKKILAAAKVSSSSRERRVRRRRSG